MSGPPPYTESRSQTPCTMCTAPTTLCTHQSLHIMTTPSRPSAPARVSHPALTPSHRLCEHLGSGLAPPPRSRTSNWHQQLCSKGRRRGYWLQSVSRLLHWAHPQISTCPTCLPHLMRPYHPRGWTVCQPSYAELCTPTCTYASCMTSG